MGRVLAWVTWVVCRCGSHASLCGMGGMLAWVVWVDFLHAWCASVGDVPAWVTWVVCISRTRGILGTLAI